MPPGVLDPNGTTAAFFSGRVGMILISTGSLGFIRDNMKQPFRTAFVPKNVVNAAPVGGGSLIIPAGNSPERQTAAWTLIKWLTSPDIAGQWSRFTGYFAPNRAAYGLPEMKQYMAKNGDAGVALDQLNRYGRGWFATYKTVPVRKAMEDQVQAILNGDISAEAAAARAQSDAEALLRPYLEQTALKLPT
jgi:sn-glycerol 3-phosphate transport system substrate-binding protein